MPLVGAKHTGAKTSCKYATMVSWPGRSHCKHHATASLHHPTCTPLAQLDGLVTYRLHAPPGAGVTSASRGFRSLTGHGWAESAVLCPGASGLACKLRAATPAMPCCYLCSTATHIQPQPSIHPSTPLSPYRPRHSDKHALQTSVQRVCQAPRLWHMHTFRVGQPPKTSGLQSLQQTDNQRSILHPSRPSEPCIVHAHTTLPISPAPQTLSSVTAALQARQPVTVTLEQAVPCGQLSWSTS